MTATIEVRSRSSLHEHSSPKCGLAAIRHLASYYAAILADSPPSKRQKTSSSATVPRAEDASVILLTDDADNQRKALAGGITAFSVKEYVELQAVAVSSVLMDLLAAVGTGPYMKRGAALYPEVSWRGEITERADTVPFVVPRSFRPPSRDQSWQAYARALQPEPVQLQGGASRFLSLKRARAHSHYSRQRSQCKDETSPSSSSVSRA